MQKGFTLIELLIIITILGLLSVALILGDIVQLKKGHDALREKDLYQLKTAFENYYADHDSYPYPAQTDFLNKCGSTVLSPYLDKIPCDPTTKEPYQIWTKEETYTPQEFIIYAKLEGPNHPSLVICNQDRTDCTPGDPYNYCVSSENIDCGYLDPIYSSLPSPSLTPSPTPATQKYYCMSYNNCTSLDSNRTCPSNITYYTAYCDNRCIEDKFICYPISR